MRASQRATIAGVFADLLKDAPAILKEQQNIRNTRPDMAEHMAAVDPAAKIVQFEAAMTNLATALGMAVMGDAMGVLDRVTKGLTALGDAVEAHPTIARVLTDVGAGLGTLAGALGVLSTAIFVFGPALKLLGIGGGTAAGATAAGRGGLLGAASRAAMSAGVSGAGAAGAGVALVGGALYLGGTTDPLEAERRLNLTRQQQRSGANLTPQDADAEGRPINMTGKVMLDGKLVGEFVGNSLAKGASGPSGGTTGHDIRAGLAGGLGGMGR